MELRSCCPLWALTDQAPIYPRLTQDETCDVAIIGAGVAGAMVAYDLAAAGLSCIVLDRRSPGQGSTAASTALLMFDLDTPLHKLEREIGSAHARRCYCMGVE